MKVVTVFGTRPEIIRLSLIMPRLDAHCEHVMVHTGQNYDKNLSDIFLRDLRVRTPDIHLGIRSSNFGEQIGQILTRVDQVLAEEQPDRLLILGDTNSALSAIVAARRQIPVFHMEAGNRCYDDRVPEEVNRRLVDHASTMLLPYTQGSKENLVREGIERERIYVIGNPIYEVLQTFNPEIEASNIHARLDIMPGAYFLVTLHRSENVDDPRRLEPLLQGLSLIASTYAQPLLVSVHPRTANKMKEFGLHPTSPSVRLLQPMGFFDFVKLERTARAVLSDSGTVQEECAIFGVPNVTLRDVTERPETIACGSNILASVSPDTLLRAVQLVLSLPTDWKPPEEYVVPHVSATVAKIVLGHVSIKRHGVSL